MTSPIVAGHELPGELAAAIERGSWPTPISFETAASVFGEDPEPSAAMYSLDEMIGETSRWQDEDDPAYLGREGETLDPGQSILIGDLGYDRPVGIDLRSEPPVVRFLTIDGRWTLAAASVTDLLSDLGLAT